MRRLTDRAQAPPTHGGDKERALLSSHSIELKIQSELKSAMYNPEVPGKRFITYEKLCAVWANTSIDSIESFRSFFLEELQLVRRNYMRVLSILIYIGWDLARFRPVFLRCDLDDDKLCFDSDQLHELGELAPNFNDVQYIFKPVQIDSRPEIQSVSTKLRLPFTSMNEMSGTDGPGVVSRRVIAAGQFIESIGGKSTRTNKDPMVVACKQFEADFRWAPRARETRAYSIIRERSRAHEGILTHFATLAHGNDFIIVFPFAQHYSLEVFFKEGDEKRPTNLNQGGSPQVRERYHFTKKFPLLANSSILHLTMLSQACKLVDALLFLQKELQVPGWGDSYCVHENLEPPEILIDGNPSDPMTPAGTWKLTDFGLSMYEKGTDTRNIRHLLLEELSQGVFVLDEVFISNLSHNSGYLSPEQGSRRGIHEWPRSYHRERDDSLDWRKTDSWSVGCLLCELLAFSLSRRRGVDILRRARRDDFGIGFYETYGDSNQPMSQIYRANIRIKQSVLSWLHESAKAKPTYVSVVDQILRPYPEDRPNMRRIRSLLGALESGKVTASKTRRPTDIR
ncbi:uncharacterized protein KY384_004696 [Bacidia gigantensis]|uniref:uncharacterized protein n=1 Tax=Bacidia gigantensis TaxID=2732470 RepID=UPI001D03A79A|nr:uncharacterized protein KY384_004696 [Bacidia gigantensis]KAG8530196.1 hypothetical protein KY384_004696 [Bacidia gigantensis]